MLALLETGEGWQQSGHLAIKHLHQPIPYELCEHGKVGINMEEEDLEVQNK